MNDRDDMQVCLDRKVSRAGEGEGVKVRRNEREKRI